eukprot:scaffold63781_cov32-Prasinocladus_malaysianus.AAC.1
MPSKVVVMLLVSTYYDMAQKPWQHKAISRHNNRSLQLGINSRRSPKHMLTSSPNKMKIDLWYFNELVLNMNGHAPDWWTRPTRSTLRGNVSRH